MESGRFERSARAGRLTRLLAGALATLAAASAWAGTDSGSFGVGLHLSASCQVDSAAVIGAGPAAALPAPDVSCAFGTPRSIRLTRESDEAPVLAAPSARPTVDGSRLVMTLTF